ncbi:uncharacterized protein ACNS7B_004653 isoform 1-T2 [Menidia menidia]
MSLTEDSSREPEMQEDEFLKTRQAEKRTINPFTLIKEDFSQFKEDMMKVFKDKDTNQRATQSAEKRVNPLALLKEDFNHFKEDFSSVFKIGLLKERENREESSTAFTVTPPNTERVGDHLKSLFRGDRNILETTQKSKNKKQDKKSEKAEDTATKQSRQTEGRGNEIESGELNGKESVEEAECKSSPRKQQSLEILGSNTGSQGFEAILSAANSKCGPELWSDDFPVAWREEEEDETTETPLSSGETSWSLKDGLKNQSAEDPWSLKNFASYLTLDPNTASSELYLTEGNRRATRSWLDVQTSEHPERFQRCPQVLCREGLLDSVYWEVTWKGGADVGVTYNSISRDGDADCCLLGQNPQSWSLECSEGAYTPCHNRRRLSSSSPQPFSNRVGIYLDWPAGCLSFYCVSEDRMVHLHTFRSSFTQPLYPGFWVWAYDGWVSLCQVELGWERLLN